MRIALALISLFFTQAHASVVSYRSTHPIAWMHGLPTGESPGWSDERWFITELQHGNFWNAEMDLKDQRTGELYTYSTDFEQLMVQLEAGFKINEHIALSAALPMTSRFGGFLDRPLDDWHRFVGADRFRRHHFPWNQNNFSIKKNGIELLETNQSSGLNSGLVKLKWWLLKPKEEVARPEFHGLSISLQGRLPLRGSKSALTTGHAEGSALIHGGGSLFGIGYYWISAGITKLSSNPVFSGWPTRQWAQVYETWLEFPIAKKWDFIAQLRYESPLLDKQHLEFQYTTAGEKMRSAERAASGWNGLTAWRGSEALGFRYHLKEKKNILFLFQEDWALGDNDGRKNFLYVHGTPDVALIAQFQTQF